MLPSVSSLNSQILALSPNSSESSAMTNLVNVIAAFLNQMQAGATGSPGIFTYNNSAAISAMSSLPNAADSSWVSSFANGVHAGATAATLAPGTVVSPAWTASGVDTLPPTNTGLSAALSVLVSGLNNCTYSNNPAMPMAQAISDYAKAFTFLCTGLVLAPPGPPIPLPLTFNAQ
jgi:hypothetical protein